MYECPDRDRKCEEFCSLGGVADRFRERTEAYARGHCRNLLVAFIFDAQLAPIC